MTTWEEAMERLSGLGRGDDLATIRKHIEEQAKQSEYRREQSAAWQQLAEQRQGTIEGLDKALTEAMHSRLALLRRIEELEKALALSRTTGNTDKVTPKELSR